MEKIRRYESINFFKKETSFLDVPFNEQEKIRKDESYLYYPNTIFFVLEKDFFILNKTKLKDYLGKCNLWPDYLFRNSESKNIAIEIKNVSPEILKLLNKKTNKFSFEKAKESYKSQINQFSWKSSEDWINKKILFLLNKSIKKMNSNNEKNENKKRLENFEKSYKKYLGFVIVNSSLFIKEYFEKLLISVNKNLIELQKESKYKYDGIILLIFNLKKTEENNYIYIIN